MPKSKHRKVKHLPQSKRKASPRPNLESVSSATSTPAPSKPAPSASATAHPTKPTPIRYPYVTAELKRIGILSAIMLVILVVLALVLS